MEHFPVFVLGVNLAGICAGDGELTGSLQISTEVAKAGREEKMEGPQNDQNHLHLIFLPYSILLFHSFPHLDRE